MMSNILLIGPFDKPITGVSVSNDLILKKLKANSYSVDYINTSFSKFDENVGQLTLWKSLYFLRLYFMFYKIIKFQIIYLTPGDNFYGVLKYSSFILFSKLFNKKIVLHIHSNTLLNEYNKLPNFKKRIMKFIISQASIGIVLSNSLRRNLKPFLPPERVFVLSNFVENDYILSENDLKHKKYENLKIVFLSNLMTQKGVFYLFEALRMLSEKGIEYEAKFAGNIDNSIRSRVNKEIEQSNIEYLGIVTGSEKQNLLKWGNVFVFPSFLTEGLPISILENMASGNLVITTKHDSLLDLDKNVDLIFIEKKSSKDIYEKISSILKNKDSIEKSVSTNYNFIKSKSSEDIFFKNLERVFL